jgi:transposase-like protein
MTDNGPRCPSCASGDVAVRGIASTGTTPSTHQVWECKACHFVFAYRPGKKP